MQTTLLGLAIAFIIALVAALIGPYFIDWNQFRPQFETEATRVIGAPVRVGGELEVRAWIHTGMLAAGDLVPQVYLGRLHEGRVIVEPVIVPMENQGAIVGDGVLFRAVIPCRTSGTHGLTVRVLPHHEDLGHPHETGLIAWAS